MVSARLGLRRRLIDNARGLVDFRFTGLESVIDRVMFGNSLLHVAGSLRAVGDRLEGLKC